MEYRRDFFDLKKNVSWRPSRVSVSPVANVVEQERHRSDIYLIVHQSPYVADGNRQELVVPDMSRTVLLDFFGLLLLSRFLPHHLMNRLTFSIRFCEAFTVQSRAFATSLCVFPRFFSSRVCRWTLRQ